MNQTQLADLLALSASAVSRLCSGERRPSLDLMFIIHDRLAWPIEDQINEIRCGSYASMLRQKMEATDGAA